MAHSPHPADWAFHADDEAVHDALARGTQRPALEEYFGPRAYARLSRLARGVRPAQSTRAPRILIVPGIMGSRLGAGAAKVWWIDPTHIGAGRLADLALTKRRRLRSMGVLLFSYARLRLELEQQGFAVQYHSYDWRNGLDTLGAQLAARLAVDEEPTVLIGHSMGALVARAALPLLRIEQVPQLIMLGAPTRGSFACVQALRGTYPFVRKLSALDLKHTADELAARVFRTFPGLYHMLPVLPAGQLDVYDANCWPAGVHRPDAQLLREASRIRAALAPADARMSHIVGVNQETVVGMRRTRRGFDYELSRRGDGTVPLALARLRGARTFYVEEQHGNLANNPRVIRTILDLLRRGRSALLPQQWRAPRERPRRIDDSQLRRDTPAKIDWRRLSAAQRAAILGELDSGRLAAP